jgi:TPR repeat protein
MGLGDILENRAERRAQIQIWMAAAASDDVDAQLSLAWEYARGDVLDLDVATAWHWFERAAASGQEEALVNRARFLQLRGVPEGVRELRRLAAIGNWKAQFWLGQQYRSRRGRLNKLRAVVWFDRSVKSGNAPAEIAKLAELTRLAPLWSKPFFVAKGCIKMVATVWQLTRSEQQPEVYHSLLYRLKNRNN